MQTLYKHQKAIHSDSMDSVFWLQNTHSHTTCTHDLHIPAEIYDGQNLWV